MILLSVQVSVCVVYFVEEWSYPFSSAKSTAEWLEREGLAHRPLVIEPDTAAPAILGYTGIASAYYPTCHCFGSYVVFRQGRDVSRQVTSKELQAQHREFGSAPVVISSWKIPDDDLQPLGLRLLYVSPHGLFWPKEDLFVYDSSDVPAIGAKR